MKRLWTSHLMGLSAFGAMFLAMPTFSAQAATISPEIVVSPVNKGFVPLGFDDNDNTEIIVHGEFPNTCYKTGPVSAIVDEATKTIVVDARSYRYSGACAEMLVPFIQVAKVGVVTKGDYKIEVYDHPEMQVLPLSVKEATTSNPDDFLYAPVETVSLDSTDEGAPALKVEGTFPLLFTGCMILDEVRVSRTPGEVLIVLPIAHISNTQSDCVGLEPGRRFSKTVALPSVARGEYLVHVRVLAGNSVNRLIQINQ